MEKVDKKKGRGKLGFCALFDSAFSQLSFNFLLDVDPTSGCSHVQLRFLSSTYAVERVDSSDTEVSLVLRCHYMRQVDQRHRKAIRFQSHQRRVDYSVTNFGSKRIEVYEIRSEHVLELRMLVTEVLAGSWHRSSPAP